MKLIKKYPLATFFIGAFIISWLIWGIGIASTRGWINFKVSPDALLGIGAIGPFIAALIIIGTTSGSVGLREYVKRIVKWKVGIKWILIAVFSFVIGIFVQSILYTWTYNSSGGSILMAMLLHGGFNTATMGGGEQVIMYLGGFFFLAAILVVIFARPANLSYSGKYTI